MRSNKIRKAKLLWKLYFELRNKRCLCKQYGKELERLNAEIASKDRLASNLYDRISELEDKLHRRGHVLRFAVPQENVYLDRYARDMCASAHYAERRVAEITDAMKIQLVNDLLGKGYMKKCDVEPLMTTYELVINEE